MNMQLLIMILTVYNAKIGLRNITPLEFVERWRICIKALTNNPHFLSPDPTLAAQTSLCKRLEKAMLEAESGDRNKIAHRNRLFAEARDMFRLMVHYVNVQAKGSREIIRSAGLEEKKSKGASFLPGQVQGLRAEYKGVGKIKLLWNPLGENNFYHIQYTTDPVRGKWKKTRRGTKGSRFIVTELDPGVEYFFRVRGSNSVGAGQYSEVTNFRCG